MNVFETETQLTLLDFAAVACEFTAHWFVQSTLLITIGLVMGRLLRSRGSAVQSLVYRTTLAATLICPLATWGLSVAGFSGYAITLADNWAYELVERQSVGIESSIEAETTDSSNAATNMELSATPKHFPVVDMNTEAAFSNNAGSFETVARRSSAVTLGGGPPSYDSKAQEQMIAGQTVQSSGSNVARTLSVQSFGIIALGAVTIWLLIASLMVLRICVAWWQLVRLRRTAVKVDHEIVTECRELSRLMKVAEPDIRRIPDLPSPCLAGVRRPVILLPDDDMCLSMRNVLVHELAHLRRHDCHWNLLRQLATACFFFQPLLWILSRRIETTAEEVCDDHVVQFGGDRYEYAHRLVDIAELSTAPIAAAGVGIVSLRSMLEKRVTRMLDTSRTLSTRVGNLLLTAVLLFGLASTVAVGLIGLGPQSSPAETAEAQASETEAEEKSGEDQAKQAIPPEMLVSVVDEEGKSVANAKVERRIGEDKITAQTDDAGIARLELPGEMPELLSLHVSDGDFVPVKVEFRSDDPEPIPAEFTFKVRAGKTINGKIINGVGKPVVGATVTPFRYGVIPPTGRVQDDWFERAVKTNAKGEWAIQHVTKGLKQFDARVVHPDFANDSIRIGFANGVNTTTDGDLLAMQKGVSVRGTITDPAGKPLANTRVMLSPKRATPFSWTTRTNDQGEYEFKQVKRDEVRMTAIHKDFAPQTENRQNVVEGEEIELQLQKGETVQMSFVDQQGNPVEDVRVVASWWIDGRSLKEFTDEIPRRSDADGNWIWKNAPKFVFRSYAASAIRYSKGLSNL